MEVTALILAAATAVSSAQASRAAQLPRPEPRELAWIGLFNSEIVEWLENENRLAELCTARPGSDEWSQCQEARLQPKVIVIPVRVEPRIGARRLGQIVVVSLPGKGLKTFASAGATARQFTPDLFDADWGYGPWFHQTVLARRGLWFRVPVPAIGTGWINAEEWSEREEFPSNTAGKLMRVVTSGDILITPRGDMFVLGQSQSFNGA